MISENLKCFILWFCNRLLTVVYFVYYAFGDNIPEYHGSDNEELDGSDDNGVISTNNSIDQFDNHAASKYPTSVKKRPSKLKEKIKNKPSVQRDENIELSIENAENIYKLKNPYCVVIGNVNFEGDAIPRNGGDTDVANIERLLKGKAKFKTVETHFDCKKIKILEIIDNIAKSEKTSHHDGFVCFITSHGTSEGIRSVEKNGYVTVDQLTTRLNGKQCESLRGKPKLFFIQACRGVNTDKGVRTRGFATDAANTSNEIVPRLPTEADFLVCYATTKGNKAYRRFTTSIDKKEMGSWFISVVTNVFSEYMHKEDVMQMMIRVNDRVASMAKDGDHVDGQKEMPCQMHRLRSRVMFGNNGLH